MQSDLWDIRPWGRFTVIYEDEGVKVKRLLVNPGGRTSLQSHMYRRESWTIISGTGLLTIQGLEVSGIRGQLFNVPLGSVHRITNVGKDVLEIVEVQTGVCDEDDIERYEDDYDRDVIDRARSKPRALP